MLRRLPALLLVLAPFLTGSFLLAAPAAVAARGFVNDSAQWQAMPAAEKAAYVRGLNDSANFIFVDESLDGALAKSGRTRCLIEKKTPGAAIVEMITTAYTKEAATFANVPPLVVYIAKVGQYCRDVINRQRAEFGLPPQ